VHAGARAACPRRRLCGPLAGKSTLLKLMTGDLEPTVGTVTRHSHLSIGRYHQHSVDQLNPNMTVLEFFMHRCGRPAGERLWPALSRNACLQAHRSARLRCAATPTRPPSSVSWTSGARTSAGALHVQGSPRQGRGQAAPAACSPPAAAAAAAAAAVAAAAPAHLMSEGCAISPAC
jgi:hypothetical protein